MCLFCFRFDWQRHVNTLNFSRQFVTQISGLDIHFIHVKPPQVISASITAYPILLLHSFPTSGIQYTGNFLVYDFWTPPPPINFVHGCDRKFLNLT